MIIRCVKTQFRIVRCNLVACDIREAPVDADRGVGRPPPQPPELAPLSGYDSWPVPGKRRSRNPDES